MVRPHARASRPLRARIGARILVRIAAGASGVMGAGLLGGCDIPTSLPKWDTTFVVQSENTTVAAAQLLPASVTVNGDQFAISVSPVSFSQDLAGLCASCTARAAEGGSRPAFLGSFEASVALPADVASATLVGGRVDVTLTNGFSFDPLRANAKTGQLTITVRSGTRIIGSSVVTGAAESLPPGGRLAVAVPVQGEAEQKLGVSVEVSAPADDSADELGGKLDVIVTPGGLRASAGRFSVQARHVTAKPVYLKLASLDKAIINRARTGAILLSFTNPLGVSGTLMLRISGGPRPLSKPVLVAPGDSDVEVPFDASDLAVFLGYDVTMTLAGSVSAADHVTLTPDQLLSVGSRLKLTLGPLD